ncbi:hypothetical protein BpHYR1_042844 [Brachionus plicatilis]|uniref:Uncharacterized protein n=1 Tax=Brachionus plicatilis TaxID=10195 RepID=A0A3M7SFA4_BRAPC|nr:hypothetical protein BpHYR1_042844 [Brachionus plicatilis]
MVVFLSKAHGISIQALIEYRILPILCSKLVVNFTPLFVARTIHNSSTISMVAQIPIFKLVKSSCHIATFYQENYQYTEPSPETTAMATKYFSRKKNVGRFVQNDYKLNMKNTLVTKTLDVLNLLLVLICTFRHIERF